MSADCIEYFRTDIDNCYNYNNTKIKIPNYNNISFKDIIFNESLQEFSTDLNFNFSLDDIKFPDFLKLIKFGDGYDLPINNIKFPNLLELIKFGESFNQSLSNVNFPQKLIVIEFHQYSKFNQSLENVSIPNSVKKIMFGRDFNQSIENTKLPNSLEYIKFGDHFNQPLYNVKFPFSFNKICLGNGFKQTLNFAIVPPNLSTLEFSQYNEKSISNEIINTNLIKKLVIHDDYCENACHSILPVLLEELIIHEPNTKFINLPITLKKIVFYNLVNDSPYAYVDKIPFGCKIIVKN